MVPAAVQVVQIILAVLIIIAVVLQARGRGVGGIFGEGGGLMAFKSRRGIEKVIFRLTIILGIIFIFLAALSVSGVLKGS